MPSYRFLYSISTAGFIAIILLTGCTGCQYTSTNSSVSDTAHAAPATYIPDFNADSAYAFTQHIVSFGPRIPGTNAQVKNYTWLKHKMESYGATVYTQETKVTIYNGTQVPMMNIIATFNPQATKRILLLAHDDTRPWSDRDSLKPHAIFDGADDAASGVAQLIEIARHLGADKSKVGVDILFTDVEDYGTPSFDKSSKADEDSYCLGTQYWTAHPHTPNYHAYFGILLDMTGAKNATFYMEGTSQLNAPNIVNQVWNEAAAAGYAGYFIKQPVTQIIDDNLYVNKGLNIPCIDIIYMTQNGIGFAPHWHTQKDNMQIISKETLKAVGQTVMNVIYKEPGDPQS